MAAEPTGWRRGEARTLVLLTLPLAWNSVTYCDLDALGCKEETASGEWRATTSERALATGEMRNAAPGRLARADEA